MHLELRKDRHGNLCRRWYGAVQVRGRRRVYSLCYWRGTPPPSGLATDPGDTDFERTREQALHELSEATDHDRSQADKAALSERIHKARYGHAVTANRLEDLPRLWKQIPRKRKASAFHQANCMRVLARFASFLREKAPRLKEMGAVTGEQAQAYFEHRAGEGIAARTWNWELSLVRGMFARFEPYAGAYRDYLKDAPGREENAIHKEPFSADEITRILHAAADDALLRSLITCAVCTALRKGDAARLRWRSVDLAEGFITVKTAKSGGTTDIPIFPQLRAELNAAQADQQPVVPDGFVWPKAARIYERTPDQLDRRLKAILVRAGFVTLPDGTSPLPLLKPEALCRRVADAVGKTPGWTAKRRDRTRAIFQRYMTGASTRQVATELGVSEGLVSTRLNELESMIGAAIVRRKYVADTRAPADPGSPRSKRGSIRGWHSFRVTWITVALAAGVPMEVVQRVSGHAAVDVVLKHYFRPGRAEMARAIGAAMPRALTGGRMIASESAGELATLSAKLAAGTATPAEVKRIRALASGI